MKRSETPKDLRELRQGYIQTRWGQLCDLETSWTEEAIKYLLIVNTGAMAASLGFIGTMSHLRGELWPKAALSLFAVGVVIIGFYHAVRYHRVNWLFKRWRADVAAYSADALEWNELLDRDEKRIIRWVRPLLLLAYTSFGCFLIGLTVAAFNFSEITPPVGKELNHEPSKGSSAHPVSGTPKGSDPNKREPESSANTGSQHGHSKNAGTGS